MTVTSFARSGLLRSLLAAGLMAAALAAQAQLAGASSAAPQAAARAQPVVAEMTQFRVVQGKDGREQLVSAAEVKPGDVIEYRVRYVNKGTQPVKGVAANLPIPGQVEYIARSAASGAARATASTGDGTYAAEPLMRTPPGKSQPEPVPYAEYRALRWNVGQLPPGGAVEVHARVRVQTTPEPVKQASAAPAAGVTATR